MGLVTSLRMVDSMVTGAMAGVPKKPTGMMIGCRLILEKLFECVLLLLQGDRNGNEWVTAFRLSYSSDAQTWTPYKDVNDTVVVRSVLV